MDENVKEPRFKIGKRIFFKNPKDKQELANFLDKWSKKKNVEEIAIAMAVADAFNVDLMVAAEAIDLYNQYLKPAKQVYQK